MDYSSTFFIEGIHFKTIINTLIKTIDELDIKFCIHQYEKNLLLCNVSNIYFEIQVYKVGHFNSYVIESNLIQRIPVPSNIKEIKSIYNNLFCNFVNKFRDIIKEIYINKKYDIIFIGHNSCII